MMTLDDIEALSGLTVGRLKAGAAKLAAEGTIKPVRGGRLPMRDAALVVTSIDVEAMSRMVSTIGTLSKMTAVEYALHQARLMQAVQAAQRSLPVPAVQRAKPQSLGCAGGSGRLCKRRQRG
jgi:hypothetical protein